MTARFSRWSQRGGRSRVPAWRQDAARTSADPCRRASLGATSHVGSGVRGPLRPQPPRGLCDWNRVRVGHDGLSLFGRSRDRLSAGRTDRAASAHLVRVCGRRDAGARRRRACARIDPNGTSARRGGRCDRCRRDARVQLGSRGLARPPDRPTRVAACSVATTHRVRWSPLLLSRSARLGGR
jgi:hypothetical protein